MATVVKTIPYEILIRFSQGEEHQRAKLGEFEGAHYIERTRFVDSKTGEIVGVPKGSESDTAIDLPREKVEEYLGVRFADFEAQARSDKNALAEARTTIERRDAEIVELKNQVAALMAARDDLAVRLETVKAALL